MICKNCGKEINDTAKKCTFCGVSTDVSKESQQQTGKKSKKIIIIAVALVAVFAALGIIISNIILPKAKYNEAMKLVSSGDYEHGYALLEEIGKDEAITESKYERATALINNENYEQAYTLLEEIGDNEAVTANKYERAIKLIDSGVYEQAYNLLSGLNYKDSEEIMLGIKSQYNQIQISKAEIGDSIFFGSYEQDNDLNNGAEDIEWQVLAKEGDKILAISKYALLCDAYDFSYYQDFKQRDNLTWGSCTLYTELNSVFLNQAFRGDEQAMIETTAVLPDEKDKSIGTATEDKVFLLSEKEVATYFTSDESRKCAATEYAVSYKGLAKNSLSDDGNNICDWWLRSYNNPSGFLAHVAVDGSIYISYSYKTYEYVRPAIWINTNNKTEQQPSDETENTEGEDLLLISNDLSVGQTISFGKYEQDNNTINGKEDIEWQVLAKEDNKALVISKYSIDIQPYESQKGLDGITWEECTLRNWLNSEFVAEAFNSNEIAVVMDTMVSADKNVKYDSNPGNDTEDKVFLLSAEEAEKYFSSDELRRCTATNYVIAKGGAVDVSSLLDGQPTSWWWLRSPGSSLAWCTGIKYDGSIDYSGSLIFTETACIRPAMWISLDS